MPGQHTRRRPLTLPVVAATSGLFLGGFLVGAAGAQPLGAVMPVAEPRAVATTEVSSTGPTPAPPAAEAAPAPRPVARVLSPCSARRAQLQATTAGLTAAYRTPTALELAEDAGTIARALYAECGWEADR